MIYYGIAMALAMLSFKDINGKYVMPKLWLFVILILLTVFAGFRYRLGYDWTNYERIFLRTPDLFSILGGDIDYLSSSRIEPLFLLLTSFSKVFTDEVNGMYILVAFLITFLIIKRLKEYTPHIFLAILLFFVGSYINLTFGLLRQGIAIALFFFSIKYIKEKQAFKYYFINIIACFFHSSAIIVLPFYYILRININKFIKIFILLVSLVLSFFDWPTVILGGLQYHFTDYLNDETQGAVISLFSLGILLKFLILFVGVFMKNRLEKRYSYYNLMLNIYFYHVVLFLLFRQNFVFGARIPGYFLIVDMILITYFLRFNKSPNLKIISFLWIIIYAFVMLSFMLSREVYTPYISIFSY